MSDESERIDQLRAHLAENPDSDRFVELAELLIAAEQFKAAIRISEMGMGFHPDLAAGHLVYGKALVSLGKLDEGVQAFERACALQRNDVGICAQAGQFLVDSGNPEAAFPYYDKGREIDPEDPRILRLQSGLPPPPMDDERVATRPVDLDALSSQMDRVEEPENEFPFGEAGEPDELGEDDDLGEDEDDLSFRVPTQEVQWPAWDSHPPPPTDAFPSEDDELVIGMEEEDEPPTVYDENPFVSRSDGETGQAPGADETILDPSAGLRAEVSDAFNRAAKEPGEPPTMFDPSGEEGQTPWAESASGPEPSLPGEPPTMFEGAQERRKQLTDEPPPTKFTTSPDGAVAPFREIVATPSETFSYLKVFLVLIPFLVVGLALGGWVAFRHIRSEKISTLLDQAQSSVRLDTFHAYGEALATLKDLLELDDESVRGRSLLALVKARLHDEYGPNLSLRDESSSLLEELRQTPEAPGQDTLVDSLTARFHIGEADDIASEVDKLLQSAPGQADLLALAGEIAARQGKVEQATGFLEKSLNALPSSPRNLHTLAMLKEKSGDRKRARELLERALAINGIHAKSLVSLARLRVLRGTGLDRAKSDLEKVIELPRVTDRQRAEAYLWLARLSFLQFDRTRGVAEVKAATKLMSGDVEFKQRLAKLCLEFNELDEANLLAGDVLEKKPDAMDTRLLVIDSNLPRGRAGEALEALDALAGKKVPAAPFLVLRGESQIQLGRFQNALADLERVPRKSKERRRARALTVLALLGLGNADQAYRQAIALTGDHPKYALGHYALGRYRLSKRLNRSAAAAFSKAVELDPRCYQAYGELAWMAYGNRKYDEAAQMTEKALAANPHDVRALELKGRLRLLDADAEGALAAFARLVQEQPRSQEGFLGMAEALLDLNRIEKALLAIERAQKVGATDAGAYHLEGRIHLAMGKFFRATRALSQADRLDKKNAEILADLGLSQLGTRAITRAERSFKESLKRRKLPRAQEGLARVLRIRRKYKDAGAAFEKAARYAKRSGWKTEEVARLYMDGGRAWLKDTKTSSRYAKARRLFRLAANLLPDNPDPVYEIAAAWDRDEKLGAARKEYQRVLEMNPKHAKSLYRLGLLEFDEGNDEKAKEYLGRYIEADPKGKNVQRAKTLLKKIK